MSQKSFKVLSTSVDEKTYQEVIDLIKESPEHTTRNGFIKFLVVQALEEFRKKGGKNPKKKFTKTWAE